MELEVGGIHGDEEVKFAEMNQLSRLPQKSLLPYIHFGRFYSLFSESIGWRTFQRRDSENKS